MQNSTAREPKTILIIEDSPALAFAIGQLLKANRLRVQYAMDGLDGFRMALAYVPDAIILDLDMPRMDGLETLKCLQADPQTAEIPVVVLTQPADRADLAIDSVNRGAVGSVPKDDNVAAVLLEALRWLVIL
jgi:putative two-component system response regulator